MSVFLISRLQGKVLRTLLRASDSTFVLKAEPGKLETWYSIYQFTNCFTLQSDYDVIFEFCVESAALTTSFKKSNGIMT